MVTQAVFRPHSFPSIFFSTTLAKPPFVNSMLCFSFSSSHQTETRSPTPSTSHFQCQTFSYGPSLRKGKPPTRDAQNHLSVFNYNKAQQEEVAEEERNANIIDVDTFTRVFDIAALRVPSKDCFTMENRLRGHLLNWPRICNIARVPGDDIDPEFVDLVGIKDDSAGDEKGINLLQQRVYEREDADGEGLSPVLCREKLVKTFNSRGFARFKNLAKISRPKIRKKREIQGRKSIGKSDFAFVEVVEDEEDAEKLRGLLGDDFKGKKWRGSTRLLLLDERCADKGVEELPEAVKAVLEEGTETSTKSNFKLVLCKLTLFYSYWPLDEILEALLPDGMVIPSAFETVGHIAHLNLRDEHLPFKKLIAKVVLDKNKPKIQTVVNKTDPIHSDYRTMSLEVLAGNHSLVTMVIENGLRFHVDLAAMYWNSRLATERQRLVNCFSREDVVCDVFSGAGPIAIAAAKKVKYVYANDLNRRAVEYLERNSVFNNLERKIEVFNMDGRRFINAICTNERVRPITQVVMNLPNDAVDYLDAFRGAFRNQPKERKLRLPTIHVYAFSKAPDPEFDFHEQIRIALSEVAFEVKMQRVRLVAPGKWMLCASFVLPESVAFAKIKSDT